MEKRFVYIKTKANLTDALKNQYNKSIVFIEDSKEIFTHGKFYGLSTEVANRITAAESDIDALLAAVAALQGVHAFTTLSDGTHTALATSTAKTISFKATGKATVTVGADGVTIGAAGTSLGEGSANGQTSVDGTSKKIVKGLDTAAYHPDTYFYTATAGTAAKNAADAAQATADAKVASVTSGSLGIAIGGTTTAPTVGLKLDNSGNVKFSEGASGLKASVTIPAATVTGVKANDKVLALDGTNLTSTLNLVYDSTNKEIKLQGIGGATIASVDATDFIKDGMVNDVSFNTSTKILTITFNTASGKDAVDVDLTSLVDTYTAGNGITISGNLVAAKLDTATETFLTVGSAGIKLSGVLTAINTAKSAVIGNASDAASVDTIKGAKKYADSLAVNYATKAQGVKADSALLSIAKGTDGSYVTTSVGSKSSNQLTIGVSVKVQAVSSATSTAKGLAEASDVKAYADGLFDWVELD